MLHHPTRHRRKRFSVWPHGLSRTRSITTRVNAGNVIGHVGNLNHLHVQWCDHLYGAGTCQSRMDLPTRLRLIAACLRLQHPVRRRQDAESGAGQQSPGRASRRHHRRLTATSMVTGTQTSCTRPSAAISTSGRAGPSRSAPGPDVSNPGYGNDIGTWYVGDFNGDGYTDLVHSADRGNVYFWPGSATGPRQDRTSRTRGTQMTSVPGMSATSTATATQTSCTRPTAATSISGRARPPVRTGSGRLEPGVRK